LAFSGWILPFDQTHSVPRITGSALASASWGYECTQGHCRTEGESGIVLEHATGVFHRRGFEPRVPYRSLVSSLSDCEKEIAACAVPVFRPFVSPGYSKFFKSPGWPKPTIEK